MIWKGRRIVALQADQTDRDTVGVLLSVFVAFAGGALFLFGLAMLSFPTLNPHVYWPWFPDFVTQPFSLVLSVLMVAFGSVLFVWVTLSRKSRKRQLVVVTSTIILLACVSTIAYPFLFAEQAPGIYGSGWVQASVNPLITGKFRMLERWVIEWTYTTNTHQAFWLDRTFESELVIVVFDAYTRNVVYNLSAYANTNQPYEFMSYLGTFYLSVTAPHAADDIPESPWHYAIACHTGLPSLFG